MIAKRLRLFLLIPLLLATALRADDANPAPAPEPEAKPDAAATAQPAKARIEVKRVAAPEGRKARVYTIPIRQEINQSALFILRRGLKNAIEAQADLVLIDMDTPGGALDVTLEMMNLLKKFEGQTATFVDEHGLSAGAFISAATRDVYFSPNAVVGSAAPVQGGGEDIASSMREKIMSFLKARVRAIMKDDEHRYRADVVTAMMDSDFVLKVDGFVLKDKGSLLAVNAEEAAQLYGSPPQSLFSSGTADSIEDLLNKRYGEGNWERTSFEVSWSVELAKFLTSSAITSLLLGAGLLCLYLEFKTPGFGAFGITGGILLGLVFFGHHVAGLSGQEPALVFILGLTLVILELFLFPGTIIAGATGAVLILGALLWAMADIWPQSDGTGFVLNADLFLTPIYTLGAGLGLSIAGAVALWTVLPKTTFYKALVLETPTGSVTPATTDAGRTQGPAFGSIAVALTDLHPSGEVEIGGRRFGAMLVSGSARAGDRVRVVGSGAFEVRVEPLVRIES